MINYFQLYQLPVSFSPDATLVKAKYYALSRAHHPDRFAQATDHEKAEHLRMAAINNDAYKTLGDADRLIAYILKLNNLLEDEEKYSLPPAFLMEMMELNETISESEEEQAGGNTNNKSTQAFAEHMAQWTNEITPLTDRYNKGEQTDQLLLEIKDLYFRKKYLLRIQERIDRFAAR